MLARELVLKAMKFVHTLLRSLRRRADRQKRQGQLLVTLDFPPGHTGGIARYYADLAFFGGGRIFVLTGRCRGSGAFDEQQPYRVTRVRLPSSLWFGSVIVAKVVTACAVTIQALLNVILEGRGAIVAGHWFLAPGLCLVARICRRRSAVILHGGELSRFESQPRLQRAFCWMLNRLDRVVVNSLYTERQFVRLGLRAEKVIVLTPGVDADKIAASAGDSSELSCSRGASQAVRLLTVGTLVRRKGHDMVLRALAHLAPRYERLGYVVVGDGPNRCALEALASELRVSDRVRFLGRLADGETYREMAKCDVFVMPCRLLKERFGEEGFGIVFLEAAALGKPVVAGRSGGAPEAVVDGDTGILVDPESVVSLAQALERLILDGDLRGRLGAAGLLRVRKSFQWTNRVDDFLSRLS